ncbi:LytR C-terminal domain-containing protein [Corynebacterium sp. CCM 9204]|uniref:LytR C-terminal domain-containing protein n=1 Tax=Corynebacterium sp. CCM 9204 TaxID=3057616 RepID=UPI003523FA12
MSPNKHSDAPEGSDVPEGRPDEAVRHVPVGEPRSLPLRGFAMILAAVAVLLAAWALFVGLRGDDSDTTPAVAGNTSSTAPTSNAARAEAPAASTAEEETQKEREEVTSGSPSPEPEVTPTAEIPVQPQPNSQPAPAPVGDPRTVAVHALNNSTVQGLANRAADRLTGQGWTVGEVGNLAEAYLPASAVYYNPGNPTEEAAAREVGTALGIPAKVRTPELATAPTGGVVVVLTGDVTF